MATAMATAAAKPMTAEEKKVIFASSLGTVFEWYDFYLYGSLARDHRQAVLLGPGPELGVHLRAAGVRGRLHRAALRRAGVRPPGRHDRPQVHVPGHDPDHGPVDLHRRPLPTYASIGVAAPVILIGLRMLQGLALGGEYGGAATYVAEHSPHGKRGAYTSWIQTTATLGLFLSLMVILGTRTWIGEVGVRRLGLARSVPGVDLAARHLRVDPPVA